MGERYKIVLGETGWNGSREVILTWFCDDRDRTCISVTTDDNLVTNLMTIIWSRFSCTVTLIVFYIEPGWK